MHPPFVPLPLQAMRVCVKMYLQDTDSLCHLEPKLLRKHIAEECFRELVKFSQLVKVMLQSRPGLGEKGLKLIMGWKRFEHIPEIYKKTLSFRENGQGSAIRAPESGRIEHDTLKRLWMLMVDETTAEKIS